MLNKIVCSKANFGTIRQLIWPIHSYELKTTGKRQMGH